MYAQVIVDVPTMQTNRPYTYRIPTPILEILRRGMRVVVPFGKGNRFVQGFVVDITEDAQQTRTIKRNSSSSRNEPSVKR